MIDGLEYNYAYYPVVFKTYGAMMNARAALHQDDILPRRYFYPSLNTLPFLPQLSRRPCLVSESLAERVLALPLYPTIERDEAEKITSCIKFALNMKGLS